MSYLNKLIPTQECVYCTSNVIEQGEIQFWGEDSVQWIGNGIWKCQGCKLTFTDLKIIIC